VLKSLLLRNICVSNTEKQQNQQSSGLERVAEELMGRRKWKQYQDSAQSHATDLLDKQSPSIGEFLTNNIHLI
jgi:hypothetical protein